MDAGMRSHACVHCIVFSYVHNVVLCFLISLSAFAVLLYIPLRVGPGSSPGTRMVSRTGDRWCENGPKLDCLDTTQDAGGQQARKCSQDSE
jgi:hypothetical protein